MSDYKSENVFRKRTGNLINTVVCWCAGSKVPSGRRRHHCNAYEGPAGTSPPPPPPPLVGGNLVNLPRKRRVEEHKWLACAKGKPLSLIIPLFPLFFPFLFLLISRSRSLLLRPVFLRLHLFLFSHYISCPLAHRNANVFIFPPLPINVYRTHRLLVHTRVNFVCLWNVDKGSHNDNGIIASSLGPVGSNE